MRAQRGIAFAFLLGIIALTTLSPARPAAAPTGQMTWAVHFTLAPRWIDPGPRVEEAALTLVPSFPYSAPYEDVRLKP